MAKRRTKSIAKTIETGASALSAAAEGISEAAHTIATGKKSKETKKG